MLIVILAVELLKKRKSDELMLTEMENVQRHSRGNCERVYELRTGVPRLAAQFRLPSEIGVSMKSDWKGGATC